MLNDTGLFVSRVALGASIAAHGAQKAFGSFGGPGPVAAAQFMESLGFVPGERYASAAAWTEIVSGALIVAGFGGPAGPAGLISTMIVAQAAVHVKNGYFAQNNGIELGVMYAAGALAFASSGFGRLSLDERLGWQQDRRPWLTGFAVAAGIAASCVVLAGRKPPTLGGSPGGDDIAVARDHIAAAQDDRPVPADLMSTAETIVPQT